MVTLYFFTLTNMILRSVPSVQNINPFNLKIEHIFDENHHNDQQIFRSFFNILLSFLGYGSISPITTK